MTGCSWVPEAAVEAGALSVLAVVSFWDHWYLVLSCRSTYWGILLGSADIIWMFINHLTLQLVMWHRWKWIIAPISGVDPILCPPPTPRPSQLCVVADLGMICLWWGHHFVIVYCFHGWLDVDGISGWISSLLTMLNSVKCFFVIKGKKSRYVTKMLNIAMKSTRIK